MINTNAFFDFTDFRYGGTLTALAPRANLSDKFVADPSEFFTTGTLDAIKKNKNSTHRRLRC
jgi:hypothetical protein